MPKKTEEPVQILWARVRYDWWNVFVVLGEEITRLAKRAKYRASREVLEWERERTQDERY